MVQCRNCGFLAVRNVPGLELCALPDHWREGVEPGPVKFHVRPFCFVRALPIHTECPGETDARERFAAIVQCERTCTGFVEWQPGYTPKEHRDMLHEKHLLELAEKQRENDRRWQQECREHDRNWEAQQRNEDLERQGRIRKSDQRFALLSIGLAGCFAVLAAVLGAVLGAWMTVQLSQPSSPATTSPASTHATGP